MVLTITVVGNNQANQNPGHAVLSPNDLAQLMSGQTMTGLLNPDGTITLNSNVGLPGNQTLPPMPASMQANGPQSISSSSGQNYPSQFRLQSDQMTSSPLNPIPSLQTSSNDLSSAPSSNIPPSTNTTNPPAPNQKKTGQKRLSAKQKLALQQQQQQQQQQNQVHQDPPTENRLNMAAQSDQSIGQQPQIVATVQLPNGQIGQLIAPSGGQFWSPNAINLQQLSMAVAAATGTMPQTMSLPHESSSHNGQDSESPAMQQQNQLQNDQLQSGTQQQSSQSLVNSNQQQLVTTVQLPNNQIGQIMNRPNSGQFWPSGPISLTQLSALAQQGVVQLSPVQGLPTNGAGSQRVVEMIPHATIQGLFGQAGQGIQTISLANNGQFLTQDTNESEKWQVVGSNQVSSSLPSNLQTNSTASCGGNGGTIGIAPRNVNQFVNSSQSNNLQDSVQSAQPQRKLKRLACTCPNCRDGDNNRSSGDKKKQHICHFPECNKVYGKTSHLRAHLRWHSGERPYVCHWSFCGKKFTRSDELQRHRRTHTGEKRFQCNECLKRFMRSDHLSKHLKTHISTKKNSPSQMQLNAMSTMVTIAQDPDQMEEEKMIDDAALDPMEECNSEPPTDDAMQQDLRQNVNPSVKLEG